MLMFIMLRIKNKFFKIFFNIYSFLREKDRGGAEREGDTESEAGSRLWAVGTEPNTGLELMNHEIATWAEVGRLTDWATQVPPDPNFLNLLIQRPRKHSASNSIGVS